MNKVRGAVVAHHLHVQKSLIEYYAINMSSPPRFRKQDESNILTLSPQRVCLFVCLLCLRGRAEPRRATFAQQNLFEPDHRRQPAIDKAASTHSPPPPLLKVSSPPPPPPPTAGGAGRRESGDKLQSSKVITFSAHPGRLLRKNVSRGGFQRVSTCTAPPRRAAGRCCEHAQCPFFTDRFRGRR